MSSFNADDEGPRPRGSHGQPVSPGVARDLSELARWLEAEPDPQQLLRRIVDTAVNDISGAAYAGISMFTKAGVCTDAASDPLVEAVDQAQYDSGDGPSLDVGRVHCTMLANDLSVEARWPGFAERALAVGIWGVLSVRLFTETDTMGTLNLYSRKPNAFDDDDENFAMLLGAHASVALAAALRREHFVTALQSRDLIGQAKGILMERHKVSAQQASRCWCGPRNAPTRSCGTWRRRWPRPASSPGNENGPRALRRPWCAML